MARPSPTWAQTTDGGQRSGANRWSTVCTNVRTSCFGHSAGLSCLAWCARTSTHARKMHRMHTRRRMRGRTVRSDLRPCPSMCLRVRVPARRLTAKRFRADVDNGIGWHAGDFSPWAGQRGAVTEDTVGMRLDLTTGSLEVTLNRQSLGVMQHVRTALNGGFLDRPRCAMPIIVSAWITELSVSRCVLAVDRIFPALLAGWWSLQAPATVCS